MAMPVMNVGDVGMRVDQRFMLVRMTMGFRRIHSWRMLMLVVIIVNVAVVVLQCFVNMAV